MRAVDRHSPTADGPDHDVVHDHEARRLDHLARLERWAKCLPPDAVFSHESAALVHGFALVTIPRTTSVTRIRGRGFVAADLHVRRAGLRQRDVASVRGLRVTSPARAVVDLGRGLAFAHALVVGDAALRAGTRRLDMDDCLRHQWTWPRIRRAARVVAESDGRAETALESLTRSRFITLGLPRPRLQVSIVDTSSWVGRVDFEWKQFGVIGEADGRVKYTADELWAEKVRQDALEDAGYEVIRWTWQSAQVSDDEFRARFLRKVERGRHMRGLRASA